MMSRTDRAPGETTMSDTLARKLARFATGLRYEDLPLHVVDKAKACILHCIGVGLAGHGSGAVRRPGRPSWPRKA